MSIITDPITHGAVTIRPGSRIDEYIIEIDDDGHNRRLATTYGTDNARRIANAAHRRLFRGADVAEVFAARALDMVETQPGSCSGDPEYDRYVSFNCILGYCPDGCCGGPECMEDEEIPAFIKWEKAVRAAGRRLVEAAA